MARTPRQFEKTPLSVAELSNGFTKLLQIKHTHIHTRTHTHTHTHVRTHARTRTHTRTHARARTHTHTHARARARFPWLGFQSMTL